MAAEIIRTAADDAHDALHKLEHAEREIRSWRAHLARVQAGAGLPVALQARRSAGIVEAVIGEAVAGTRRAVCHAELPVDALPA